MPEPSLPGNWTEEVDAKGVRFYINHTTQTTQREQPTLDEPPHPREMLPARDRPSPQQAQQVSRSRASQIAENCVWTPRVTYWVAATMSLPVWILSALAASGKDWFEDEQLFAFDEDIIDQCGDESVSGATEAFCKTYIPFMVMQLATTSLASLALVLLSMATLVPASDGCCSVKPLGALGGYAVAVSALFQLVAIALILRIAQSNTAYLSDDSEDHNDLGTTFWVAVVSFTVAMFDAIFLLNFISSAGDGYIYEFIGKMMTSRG